MKTPKLLFMVLISLITLIKLNAQGCGTPSETNFPENERKVISPTFTSVISPICINVFYHIVRENNGSGGFNSSLLNEVTLKLSQAYNPYLLYINNLGFDYIDSSTYYNIDDTGNNSTEFNALVNINNRQDAINIYIINNAVSYDGRANGILSQALVVESAWANTQVTSHEVGHCLDLLHTFETSYCTEAIDGSNCSSCGDKVCDTPADANIGNNGGYNPDLTNIMSYYYPFDHISQGQATKIRQAFSTSTLLQQVIGTMCFIPEINGLNEICNSSETTYSIINGGSAVSWNVSPNLTIISSNPNSITVKPIFTSTNGTGYIEAVLATQTVRKDIWIGLPIGVISRTSEYCEGKYHYITFEVSPTYNYENYEWSYFNYPGSWYTEAGNKLYVKLPSTFYSSFFELSVSITNSCGTIDRLYDEQVKKCGTFVNQLNPITIYPNPANNILEVEINTTDEIISINKSDFISNEDYLLQIYDLQYNIIYEMKCNYQKEIKIDVTKFKNGLYILQLSNSSEKFSKQFIVKQ